MNNMKKLALILMAYFETTSAISAEQVQDNAGSNANGNEKVCMISNASNEAFKESMKNCRRGDIMALGGVTSLGAMKYCDFTKSLMYENGKIVACVFTGAERPVSK
jgi:hypothetical protein